MRCKQMLSLSVVTVLLAASLAGCGTSSTAPSAVSSEAPSSAASSAASEVTETAALPDGVYTAEFDTDSGMFHANEACDGKGTLTVKDGKMTMGLSEDAARKLWDNYYVPFVKGWFAASGRFRSDDIKAGNVLGYVGSCSSATFFPARVTNDANESHDISMKALPSPEFADGEKVAVQQGAGMVVTAGKEEEIEASVEFLKWFVQPENNIAFAVGSGYLPVTREANSMDTITSSGLTLNDSMEQILTATVDTVNGNRLYTPHAFAGSSSARKVLEYGLSDLAAADRETVEQRKERILYMNTVADHGADEREGMIAQLMLLSKAPAQRPMQLALALLKGYDLSMPAVTRRNRGVLPQLENHAMIEATLTLKAGEDVSAPRQMPDALAETMNAVDETNRLAARAAAGDRSALREVVEIDPALEGLDRLYVQDVVEKMIEMHGDVLQRL